MRHFNSYYGCSLGKELYKLADYLQFSRYKNINMFLSASLIPKVFDDISYFWDALQPKATKYKSSCILFSHTMCD